VAACRAASASSRCCRWRWPVKREQKLLDELSDTKSKLAERKVIERAKGLLMERQRFTEEQAYQKLRSMAMSKNLKLSEAPSASSTWKTLG
jgi:AmiR/NasT family two-component response regulator